MRSESKGARKTSRVFSEVSESHDPPLVLVEASSQGLGFHLILARIKRSLEVDLRHSDTAITKPLTRSRKSLRLRQPTALWAFTKWIRLPAG